MWLCKWQRYGPFQWEFYQYATGWTSVPFYTHTLAGHNLIRPSHHAATNACVCVVHACNLHETIELCSSSMMKCTNSTCLFTAHRSMDSAAPSFSKNTTESKLESLISNEQSQYFYPSAINFKLFTFCVHDTRRTKCCEEFPTWEPYKGETLHNRRIQDHDHVDHSLTGAQCIFKTN